MTGSDYLSYTSRVPFFHTRIFSHIPLFGITYPYTVLSTTPCLPVRYTIVALTHAERFDTVKTSKYPYS